MISWFHNGVKVVTQFEDPSSEHSLEGDGDELFFLRFLERDVGSYYCNVTNAYGTAISHNASVDLSGAYQVSARGVTRGVCYSMRIAEFLPLFKSVIVFSWTLLDAASNKTLFPAFFCSWAVAGKIVFVAVVVVRVTFLNEFLGSLL